MNYLSGFCFMIMMCPLVSINYAEAVEMKKAPIDTVFEQGEPNPYGKFFTGQTYLTMLSNKDEVWNSSIGNVTFEPGPERIGTNIPVGKSCSFWQVKGDIKREAGKSAF